MNKQLLFALAIIAIMFFSFSGCKNSHKTNESSKQEMEDTVYADSVIILQDTLTIEVDSTRVISIDDLSEPSGYINGHGYVDLGLSVKWATCNVGANSPSDYGNNYAWGETKTKSSYTEKNSMTYGKKIWYIEGDPQYDVARATWGDTWRMPTIVELEELMHKCTLTRATEGKYIGYIFTGPNGNSIFLPAEDYESDTSTGNITWWGSYWSATSIKEGNLDDCACSLNFDNNGIYPDYDYCRWRRKSYPPRFRIKN